MGFELLHLVVSQDPQLLQQFDAENISLPLLPTPLARKSRSLGNATADVFKMLTTEPVTYNSHEYGVSVDSYGANGNALLSAFFDVLSTNYGRRGGHFVSTVEARAAPIFGAQWHAEKPQFGWRADLTIPHSRDAIVANSFVERFLVDSARRSTHALRDESLLIYNDDRHLLYTG